MLNINDLFRLEDGEYEGDCTVWGSKTQIYLTIEDESVSMEECLSAVNRQIERLENGRADLFRALRENDDIVALAEDWVASGEQGQDEKGEYYIIGDGTKVYVPIDPDEFFAGLGIEGLNISYDFDGEILTEIFLSCAVDYFAGHSIDAFLDHDGSFEVNGLAG